MSRRCARWPLWLIAGLALGCGAPEPATRKARVEDYLRTFLIEQRWTEWPEHFAADASINGSDFALQIMRGTANGLHHSFSALELEIVEQVEEGDSVASPGARAPGQRVRRGAAQPCRAPVRSASD